MNEVLVGDSIKLLKKYKDNQFHLILSDIPYGISYEDWDVLHNNSNKALLGSSPAQKKLGDIFKHRGKPLNGWSKADKNISIDYYNWCMSWSIEWLRVLKPGASVFVFSGRRMSHRCISAMEDTGFIFKDMIAWEKDIAPHRAQRISIVYDKRGDKYNSIKWRAWKLGNLRPVFEPILWFMKPYKIGGTLADNVLEYSVGAFNDKAWNSLVKNSNNIIKVKSNKDDRGLHPAQKPVQLMEALIRLTTRKGQKVLDPFCGSGTTLVAAKKLNRKYVGIEQLPEYVDIARNRLNKLEDN